MSVITINKVYHKTNNVSKELSNVSESLGPSVTVMLGPRHRLGKRICNVVIYVHIAHSHITSINDMSDQVILPQNVSGLGARAGFLGLSNGAIVVTIDVNCSSSARNDTELSYELPNLDSLLSRFTSSNVFCLHCRICYCPLLRALPADGSSIQNKDVSRLRFKIISVCLETRISIALDDQLVITSKYQEIIPSPS